MKPMSPVEYAAFNRRKIEELRTRNKPFELAVLTSVAEVTKRAFSKAQNNLGQSFKYNSTDPIYVSDLNSPVNLSKKGKTGQDTFQSGSKKGQKHVTTYFESYLAFRKAVGAGEDAKGVAKENVNWQLKNELRGDYGNSPKTTPPEKLKPAVKIDVNHYVTQLSKPENIKKYGGLVKRYGDFLKLSQAEEQEFYRINESELGKFLSE